jgi:hypothetical protein
MQLNRPPTAPSFEEEVRKQEVGKEPVMIKAGTVMGLVKHESKPQDSKLSEELSTVSCVLGSLRTFKQTKQVTDAYA